MCYPCLRYDVRTDKINTLVYMPQLKNKHEIKYNCTSTRLYREKKIEIKKLDSTGVLKV